MEAELLTWADARARCVQLGGHLVIIESQAENQVVLNLAQSKRGSMVCEGRSNLVLKACTYSCVLNRAAAAAVI